MRLTEIVNTTEFQILFPVITPIAVSILMYIFIQPIVERFEIRNRIAGKTVKLIIEEDTLRFEGELRLLMKVVNKSQDTILVKKAYLFINKKWYSHLHVWDRGGSVHEVVELGSQENCSYVKSFNEDWVSELSKSKSEEWYPTNFKNVELHVTLMGGKVLKEKLSKDYLEKINQIFKKYSK